MKKKAWVVVANSATAIIYVEENNQTLKEFERFDHPESRLHDQDLVSSRPGRSFDRIGPGRHAMEVPSPKTQEFCHFASALVERLQHAADEGQFTRLYIAANPAFLGILRDKLPAHLKAMIGAEVDKDLTQSKVEQIRAHLPPVL